MVLTNFPNGISSFGIPVMGAGPVLTTGNVFFVSSGAGADGNAGTDQTRPKATIQGAIKACVANNGDVIMVMPGHAETVAGATTIAPNIAGVRIIGLGYGLKRPVITFATSTTAAIPVTGANVSFENMRFICNIASQVVAFDFSTAAGGALRNCDFYANAVGTMPLITVKTDASSDDMVIDTCTFNYEAIIAGTDTSANQPTEAIRLVGADRMKITNCYISGTFSTAAINGITTASKDVVIMNNMIYNKSTTATAGVALVANSTGIFENNKGYTAAAANTNFLTTFFSVASLAMGDGNVVTNSLNTQSDVSSAAVGTYFVVQKTITSSTVTTSAQDLSTVSVGGDLYIENIVLETDGTGLAGATNFRVLKNGGVGLAAIIEETVANLGANKTVDTYTASIVKQRATLATGQKLQFLGTTGAGTGAGTVKVTVVFVRVLAGANVTTV